MKFIYRPKDNNFLSRVFHLLYMLSPIFGIGLILDEKYFFGIFTLIILTPFFWVIRNWLTLYDSNYAEETDLMGNKWSEYAKPQKQITFKDNYDALMFFSEEE